MEAVRTCPDVRYALKFCAVTSRPIAMDLEKNYVNVFG